MIILQTIVVLACIVFMVLVFKQVSRGGLLLRYSFLWLTLALITMFVSIFPEPVFALGRCMDFDTPSNFVFFVALFFLLAICLSLSVVVSKQAQRVKTLVQELALLESLVLQSITDQQGENLIHDSGVLEESHRSS